MSVSRHTCRNSIKETTMLAWPIERNHAKCCGADPYCHGNEIWARRGDPDAYRLVHLIVWWTVVLLSTVSNSHHVVSSFVRSSVQSQRECHIFRPRKGPHALQTLFSFVFCLFLCFLLLSDFQFPKTLSICNRLWLNFTQTLFYDHVPHQVTVSDF